MTKANLTIAVTSMRHKLTYICFVFFLIGSVPIAVAEKQKGLPNLDIPEGKSAIYLYREKGSGGLLVKHRFFINREVLMPIGNRGCSVAFVEPGKTLIHVESGGVGVLVWTERMTTDPFLI